MPVVRRTKRERATALLQHQLVRRRRKIYFPCATDVWLERQSFGPPGLEGRWRRPMAESMMEVLGRLHASTPHGALAGRGVGGQGSPGGDP